MAKSKKPALRQQLSSADSKILIHCYAMQGKGLYSHAPPLSDLIVVLVNAEHQVREVRGQQGFSWDMAVEGMPYPSGWHVLGWRMADGSLPLGDYDAVDPIMADINTLNEANLPPYVQGTARNHPSVD